MRHGVGVGVGAGDLPVRAEAPERQLICVLETRTWGWAGVGGAETGQALLHLCIGPVDPELVLGSQIHL